MKFSIYIIGLLMLPVLFSHCVSDFNPPSQGYENLLVVDALLTDDKESMKVTLSRSFPIDTNQFIPENGAAVQIVTGSGAEFQFQEIGSNGNYISMGPINASVGESYKLLIQTSGGDSYVSEMVEMRKTPDIDSITYKYEERPTASLKGVQIYCNTHDPNNNTWYYRWEWEESWDFTVPYDSYLIWEENEVKEREERIYRCWKFGESTSIDIASSKNLTEDRIHNFPLLYVDTETDRLGHRYSLLVKQYALSEASYNYWQELQQVTENLGTLFDAQPSIVYGNIYNVNDPNEIVLGYFDAVTVSEQRIFINRSELPGIHTPNRFYFCTDSIVNEGLIPAMMEENWVLVGYAESQGPFFSSSAIGIAYCNSTMSISPGITKNARPTAIPIRAISIRPQLTKK